MRHLWTILGIVLLVALFPLGFLAWNFYKKRAPAAPTSTVAGNFMTTGTTADIAPTPPGTGTSNTVTDVAALIRSAGGLLGPATDLINGFMS